MNSSFCQIGTQFLALWLPSTSVKMAKNFDPLAAKVSQPHDLQWDPSTARVPMAYGSECPCHQPMLVRTVCCWFIQTSERVQGNQSWKIAAVTSVQVSQVPLTLHPLLRGVSFYLTTHGSNLGLFFSTGPNCTNLIIHGSINSRYDIRITF